jgi:hypothetical protein
MIKSYKVSFDMTVDTEVTCIDKKMLDEIVFEHVDEMCDRFDDVVLVDAFNVHENYDEVNPQHYKGTMPFEVIEVTEQLSFCTGNAVKYVCRSGSKPGVSWKADLDKARWYADREQARMQDGNVGFSDDRQPVYAKLSAVDESALSGVQRAKLACVKALVARTFPLDAIDELEKSLRKLLS